MKTLYLECNMGAAGDMLMASLLELHENPADFLDRLNKIGIQGVEVSVTESKKCGITGTHVTVKVNGHEEGFRNHDHTHHDHTHHDHTHHDHTHHNHEHHGDYQNIEHQISHLQVSDVVKKNATEVYKLIAEAESKAHGVPVTQVHFHEVGEKDAIADIVGVCMLIEELAPDVIIGSPINTGSGHVRCSHGILPVPAPATATILKGIPIYSDQVKGELCTPTGAALLSHFVSEFCPMPEIIVSKIGYGMGKKDFEKANCVRAFLGESTGINDKVSELVCNLDDMTAEVIAFTQDLLMAEGALDVYTTPIGMKKGRPGISLTCMCRISDRDKMLSLIFKHTTTLGLREYTSRRFTLAKEHSEKETPYGNVRIKTSKGFGISKTKPEFDDIAKIAKDNNISIQEVLTRV